MLKCTYTSPLLVKMFLFLTVPPGFDEGVEFQLTKHSWDEHNVDTKAEFGVCLLMCLHNLGLLFWYCPPHCRSHVIISGLNLPWSSLIKDEESKI